jgi:hypothetical protein
VAVPLTLPKLAVMVDVPAATPVTRPVVLTVAAAVFVELQVAWLLILAVELSL